MVHCPYANYCQPFLLWPLGRLESPGLKIVCSSSHMTPETREFVEVFTDPQFMQVWVAAIGG
jgi:hypothetical protein